ncbi:MAG: NAD-dependent epimerase/dehydratase family protein [Planctomycetota bacterium]
MRVALTGAGGFLGTALIRAWRDEGEAVRALVRRPAEAGRLEVEGVRSLAFELGRGAAPHGFVEPGDVLVHAAARVAMSGPTRAFERDTVQATRDLLRAAIPVRPSRVVYVSSGAVYAVGKRPGGYAAGRTPARPHACNAYGRAKRAAEDVVRSACERAGCPWTILRLGFLYGPGNRALLRPLVPLLERRILRVLGHGTNRIATLHVDDAARAVLLAARHPAAVGRIYDVASDERVTQAAFLRATATALGLPEPTSRVPARLAYWGAGALELWSGVTGRPPLFSRAMVGLLAVDQVLDATRIREELGWRPRVSFAEGVHRLRQAAAGERRTAGAVVSTTHG